MEYTDLTADFAKRTLQNLNYVQEQARRGEQGVYEVTQLWNSLLGLIVLPHERAIERLPTTPMTEFWPQGLTTVGREPKSPRDLLKRLRNAVAHFNVDFNARTDREIETVTMWNEELDERRRPIPGTKGWVCVITLERLEDLARFIADTYILEFGSNAA